MPVIIFIWHVRLPAEINHKTTDIFFARTDLPPSPPFRLRRRERHFSVSFAFVCRDRRRRNLSLLFSVTFFLPRPYDIILSFCFFSSHV